MTASLPGDVKAQRCLRDLLTLSGLPSLWVGKGPQQTVEIIAEAVFRILHPALVFIGAGGEAAEKYPYTASRLLGKSAASESSRELYAFLEPHLRGGADSFEVPEPGGGLLRMVSAPIGSDGRFGRIVAGLREPAVPDEIDTLLLGVCANLAAAAIHNFRAEEALRNSQAQLLQSQKLESIGQLAGGIAHDFNNLLTAINGYVELSLDALKPGEPLYHNLTEIKSAGERATSLTRQLLAYGRKQVLAPKVLNINATVRDMHAMLARLIGEDLELIRVLDAGLGCVRADPSQIEQVILNLVLNARDATPSPGTIIVETRNVTLDEGARGFLPEAEPGSYVMLSVSDSGRGMEDHVKGRIFEPFFTTKPFGKGAGMGLPMVHGIVTQSGGYIHVTSKPRQGSTFKIYLPRVPEPAAPRPGAQPPRTAPRGKETVLLVEDEEAVGKFCREVLEMNGYNVLAAEDGEAGLRLGESHAGPIDLLLTDVVMPRMNGRDLAQRIAQTRPGIGILFMSGYTDDTVVRHGLMEASTHFIQKPFLAGSLARAVREILDLTRRTA